MWWEVCDEVELYLSKKSKTMMVDGKGSGGKWKVNEERMENVFKYLGVWFDRGMRGNVHLEKMRKDWEMGGKYWLYEPSE